MEKRGRLECLKEKCVKCKQCDLCSTRTNLVFGVGNPEAKIMFIGEAPGEQEDLKGEPFVGRSGKLLDSMLENVGFSRKDNIYIANIVKCRPPKNRVPSPNEQDSCIGWLYQQVEIIRPEIIVCLGRTSASRIIKPDIKISQEHGLFFRKTLKSHSDNGSSINVVMMPMLHPAAILRNQNKKPEAIAELLRMRDYINGISAKTDSIFIDL